MNGVVLVTGCFDVLTCGHLSLIEFAAAHGAVYVGVNSDRAVKKLKGPLRPINNQEDRARLIGALKGVARAFIINDTTMTKAILRIAPTYWCKGGDYTLETLNQEERRAADHVGTTIIFAPKVEGYSTTKIIERIRA